MEQRFGAVQHVEPSDGGVVLHDASGAALGVWAYAPGVLRIRLRTGRDWHSLPDDQLLLPQASAQPPRVRRTGRRLTLRSDIWVADVDLDRGLVSVRDRRGRLLTADAEPGYVWSGEAMRAHRLLRPEDHVLGMGEKTGFLDRRGRRYAFWTTDVLPHLPDTDPMYVSVPFWLTVHRGTAVGTFLFSTFRSWVDVGREDPGRMVFGVEGGDLDQFIIAGPTLADVLRRYTALTGRMPLPPLWALGHQHSRWGHGNLEQFLDCAWTFRRRGIPCDVLYLDIDHMHDFRVMTWDPERFGDAPAAIAALQRQGFRVVTIVDPGVKVDPSYDVYRRGLAGKHFVLRPDGEVFEGKVWPGMTAFPDFLRPETRRWWAEEHAALVEAGVAGIWNDMNEPAVFEQPGKTMPDDLVHRDAGGRPRLHREVHNLYGLLMARATHEALRRLRPQERPFVLTRSGFSGVQRYAAVWTGDNNSWWEHLHQMMPMLLGMGISGLPFVGADVGGFASDATPELFARWMQAAALTPLFRNHSAWDTRRQEPWTFGPEVERIAARYIRLRYRLLPYLYTVFEEASRTGAPVMRPIFWDDPADEHAMRVDDAYLVGSDLLVAPIYQPGRDCRAVYLPRGDWYDAWTGRRYRGGRWHLIRAPLDVLPLFVRSGAALPLAPVAQHTGLVDLSCREFEVWVPARDGRRESALYEDDGVTYRYQDGAFERTGVTVAREGPLVHVELRRIDGTVTHGRDPLTFTLRWDPRMRVSAVQVRTPRGPLPALETMAPRTLADGLDGMPAHDSRGILSEAKGPEGWKAWPHRGLAVVRLHGVESSAALSILFS